MEITDYEKLEFGVYHWNISSPISLPGLLNGMPQGDYFANAFQDKAVGSYAERLNECFEKQVMNWEGFAKPNYILCSGGVDSSLLVVGASKARADIELIHTAYVKHENNDLEKFTNLLQSFPVRAHVFSVAENEYREGLSLMWSKGFYQNTYAPTITYALNNIKHVLNRQLVTGSGPDELFYGMEKYDWKFFKSLEDTDLPAALEMIDVAYNMRAYTEILTDSGLDLLENIRENRRKLYLEISRICTNVFDAQRLLAYCTVTAQHMHLFNGVSSFFGMDHYAPFLNDDLIKTAFSIPTERLLNTSSGRTSVEIGKFHLKSYLAEHMDSNHVFSRKIGFHAPTTRFMYTDDFFKFFNSLDYDLLPSFIDADRAKRLVKKRLNSQNFDDYFLFSIINLMQFNA